MDKLIAAFPQNITDALRIASEAKFRAPKNEIRNVVVCGMGGSGIGGKLVAQWIQDELAIPVYSFQDYNIPNFIDKHSLVIGSSYSGNTEETLTSVHQAFDKGAHIIGVCSGGEMANFCQQNDLDYVLVPGGNPPRSAVAFSVVQITNIFVKLGFISADRMQEIESGRQLIVAEEENIQNAAKDLAPFLKDKMLAIYSAAKYEAVAVRARQQFNENGKLLCWHHVIPEMNHNELVGWGGGDDRYAALFLDTEDLIPRNQRRFDFSVEIISKQTKNVYLLKTKGKTVIERSLYLIHLVDWASWHLSTLKQVDAMDIKVIDYLKDELSKF